MEWLLFDVGSEEVWSVLRLFGTLVAAITATGTAVGLLYRFYKWCVGPDRRHKRGADALRDEAQYRARLNHNDRALTLFDLAVQLNPRAAQTYYLRGELHHRLGDRGRARADWQRCIDRLSTHRGALERLREVGAGSPRPRIREYGGQSWAGSVEGSAGAAVWSRDPHSAAPDR